MPEADALTQICEGLAENLSSLEGVSVSPLLLGSALTPPCAEVVPGAEEYHQAYQDGRNELEFKVRVFVASGGPTRAQQARLHRYMSHTGEESVKALLEEGDGLDEIARAMKVSSRTGPRVFTRPGTSPLVGAEWTVTVWL